jgi:molecular chaperone DnaK (HSP70)
MNAELLKLDVTDRIVGIDLGTTNSLVAFMQGDRPCRHPGEDGSNLVPSVVALDENQPNRRRQSRAQISDRDA